MGVIGAWEGIAERYDPVYSDFARVLKGSQPEQYHDEDQWGACNCKPR